jgi:hypothetical protein
LRRSRLIEYVTNPDNIDPEFTNMFLMTYRSFATPGEIWNKLMERYLPLFCFVHLRKCVLCRE